MVGDMSKSRRGSEGDFPPLDRNQKWTNTGMQDPKLVIRDPLDTPIHSSFFDHELAEWDERIAEISVEPATLPLAVNVVEAIEAQRLP